MIGAIFVLNQKYDNRYTDYFTKFTAVKSHSLLDATIVKDYFKSKGILGACI